MDMSKELAALTSNLLASTDIDEIIAMQELKHKEMEKELEGMEVKNEYWLYHQNCLLQYLYQLKDLVKLDPSYKLMKWTNKFRAFKHSLDLAQNKPNPDENEIAKYTRMVIELFNDPLADHSLFPFPRITD